MSPSDLLKFTKESYDRMAETAPLIPPQVITHYKRMFDGDPKYEKITRPEESNGLEAITVYHTPTDDATATEVGFRAAAAASTTAKRPSVAVVEMVPASTASAAVAQNAAAAAAVEAL